MKIEEASRLEKLEILKGKGINPYPSLAIKRQTISKARKQKNGTVEVAGKIISLRNHGKSTFADLVDESAKLQLYFKWDNLGEKNYRDLNLLDSGDYLQIKGDLFTTHAGELTVEVKEYNILAKSLLPIPDKWYGLRDTEIRYRKRFLDLIINEKTRENLRIRSKIVSKLRRFMEENGFMEVETPILQAIPGGAAAKPFKTKYNILDQEMYLRIAPELYLKRLIVGGFEKVFEIGKNFRNEGLSHMHNPEFTMIEFYWAYQNYKGLMDFTEELISDLVIKIKGSIKISYQGNNIDFTPPFNRIKFVDLIREHCGINIEKDVDFEALKNEVIAKNIDLNFKEITTWPKLVDELYKKVARPKIVQPTFLIEYPIVLKPLAKAKADNLQLAENFQLVVGGGVELINAYNEQNDPIEQEKKFREQAELKKEGYDEAENIDENFLEALKYGMPPTAGWGMGIERLAMILCDQYSIKEVIPFPTLKNLK